MRKPVIKSKLFLLGFILVIIAYDVTFSNGESSTCLTVYKEGGAPAVFHSPKCPRWKLEDDNSESRSTSRCHVAMLQGRRKHQEDRTLCALDLMIPFPSNRGLKEVTVGIVGVFDGHNGAEASEMASKLMLEYFALHTYFLLDATYSVILKKSTGKLPNKGENNIIFQVLNWDEKLGRHELNFERFKYSLPANLDDSFHLEILKEALVRAIHDIDATFSKEAARNNLHSGSTAAVVLLVEGKILVANIGDSKALICSEKFQSPAEAKATLLRLYRSQRLNAAISPARNYNKPKFTPKNGLTHFTVKELTRDHHPDRDDERSRVETAGGYVLEWGGVPRVNGQLAVSRSIGDLSYKSYGVISLPELTGWQALTANDSYLIVSSDGVFERLSLQDVCDLLWEVHTQGTVGSRFSSSCSHSLADCVVNTAFERGSMDNVAAVVIPLESTYMSDNLSRERCLEDRNINSPCKGLQKFIYKQSEKDISIEHGHPLMTKFDRLLVEGKRGSLSCFYLSENLDDNVDHTSWARGDYVEDYAYDSSQALPDNLDDHYGGLLKSYKDQNMCLHFGMTIDGNKDQCINPEGFASFLSLLESIPFHDVGLDYGSKEHAMPDSRYVLERRFGRGSYGEVWLAFPWDCHKDNFSSSGSGINNNIPTDTIHEEDIRKSQNRSSAHDSAAGSFDDNSFILKRIMVERGPAVYLSGLREKYFGELFLNASTWLRGFHLPGTFDSSGEDAPSYFYDTQETNESMFDDSGNSWSFENTFTNKFRLKRTFFEEGLSHIARYVESFESRSNEIWLVFHHEGLSLKKLLYTVEEPASGPDTQNTDEVKHVQVLHPSKWWHWLKTTEAGQEEMQNLIWQLLMALKACHDRNITHRDIKPENMVICFEEQDTGRCLKGIPDGNKSFRTKIARSLSNMETRSNTNRLDAVEESVKANREELKEEMASLREELTSRLEQIARLLDEPNRNGTSTKGKESANSFGAESSRGGFSSCGNRSDFRSRKLELPVFDGENPDGWILKADRYFMLHQFSNEDKLEAAVMSFEGDALLWYQWINKSRTFVLWEEMKILLLKQFRSRQEGSLQEQWASVKQEASVKKYQKKFIQLAAPLENIPEEIALGKFISGLNSSLEQHTFWGLWRGIRDIRKLLYSSIALGGYQSLSILVVRREPASIIAGNSVFFH